MPIISIPTQPATDSINAAYRPVAFIVRAQRTDSNATPPVVYCDIYINSVFYKTIAKSQYKTLNITDTDWYFDIQDACQEVFQKPISPNGGSNFYITNSVFATVFCRFRSSGFDSNGFIAYENTAPIQGTGTQVPVSGTGTSSHTFFVINAVLQHEDNQNLATHLNSFKTGTWDATTYPLTHRTGNYRICKTSSDYFPILRLSPDPSCIRINYKYKSDVTYTQELTCGIPIIGSSGGTTPCNIVSIIGSPIVLPDARVGVSYEQFLYLSGDQPITIDNIVAPTWMAVGLNIDGDAVRLFGTPESDDEAEDVTVSFDLHNCSGETLSFLDTIDIANGTHWTGMTVVNEDDSHVEESITIQGEADEEIVVTVVLPYSNDFGGTITFNGLPVTALGNTFNITLDGTGSSGAIAVVLTGGVAVGHPYGMNATFEITSASGGDIGSPNKYEISKAFSS